MRQTPSKPSFGSLFAGIGGIDLGLERAGFECRWQVEIDPYCQRVLAKHWPDTPRYQDITTLTGGELDHVDLIAAGFPCQDLSLAGRRAGIHDGERSSLFFEAMRLVRALRPRYVLLENVAGLLAGPDGMGAVLGELAASGYDAEWTVLSAKALGAPHRRERVFVVAYADGKGLEERESIGSNAQKELASFVRDCRQWREDPAEREWDAQPRVGRVADGIPNRVDRLRALGNAVVPQCAEFIGRRLLNT